MRNKVINIVLLMIVFSLSLFAKELNYVVKEADFSGNKKNSIYKVSCEIDCTTTFVLPREERISEIIEPTNNWTVNSDNKRFIYIVPDKQNIHTSLDIITMNSKIYSFILEEVSYKRNVNNITKKVLIRSSTRYLSKFRTSENIQNSNVEIKTLKTNEKNELISKLNHKYKIRDKYFKITKVADDEIFTYVFLKNSQFRPAVYVKSRGRKKLELVKYVDTGDAYEIHRVLNKREYFILKVGKHESIIRRK